jgi:hypothetical protein
MSSTSNTTAIKLALTQMRAAMTALESALGTPAKTEVKETKVKEEKEKEKEKEKKVRKPTAWTAYVTEHGGVVKASNAKKADPAAYEVWATEWKEANEGEVPAPVAVVAEPKARKPRSDKGKPRAKKAVETVEEADEAEEAEEEDI